MLRSRYQIGKVLGQGGFGITYLGRDTLMETTVAIKEFYPSGVVNRRSEMSTRVECLTEKMAGHYAQSKERFLREAKALVKFRQIPEVVDLLDFVEENGTAYIVMEYVRGVDLARYIQARGGRLSVDETFRILRPVMEALAAVHKGDIVHRDISPDNIILDPMGGAKLLDFGAVRTVEAPDLEKGLAKSTEAILKHGFAPIEQYNTRGSLGPWTDEYAMCATVWYCLTGTIPEEASIRVSEGTDPDWRGIPGLTEQQCVALEKGISVRAKDRYPSMDALIEGLFGAPAPVTAQPQTQLPPQLPPQQGVFARTEAIGTSGHAVQLAAPVSPVDPKPVAEKKKRKLWPILAAVAAVVVVAILVGLLAPGLTGSKGPQLSQREEETEPVTDSDSHATSWGDPAETGPDTEPGSEPSEAPAVPAGALKTGLTVSTVIHDSGSATHTHDGAVRHMVTMVAVTVDEAGVIHSCVIDELATTVTIDAAGRIVSDTSAPVLTKNELGDDYGMVAYAGAVAEWDEQVAALCDYVVGKTAEEVMRGSLDEEGYAADADLASSATIYLGNFVTLIAEATENAEYLGAQEGDALVLASVSSLANSGEGVAQLDSTVTAVTLRDGVVTSCILDALTAPVAFDGTGTISTDLLAPILTKAQLGDAYGMVAWGAAIAEWYEQAAAFAAYVTGKTGAEIIGIAVDESGSPTEADLSSSVTIYVGEFQEVLCKALGV